MGWTIGVIGLCFPVGDKNFQTGSGAHPAYYPIGTGRYSPGGKAAGA